MASELHTFVTGALWMKLKTDMMDQRVHNSMDLVAAAYFQIRRLLLVRPDWTCRLKPPGSTGQTALTLLLKDKFQSLLQFECMLKPGAANWFPAETLDERMDQLRRRLVDHEGKTTGSAYMFGVFDTGESWFYPNETMWEKQSCFWVPIHCRQFPKYAEWRARWDRTAAR